MARQDLADALERPFKSLQGCAAAMWVFLKKELSENNVLIFYSGGGFPDKSVQKVALEANCPKDASFSQS